MNSPLKSIQLIAKNVHCSLLKNSSLSTRHLSLVRTDVPAERLYCMQVTHTQAIIIHLQVRSQETALLPLC
jgi:hypothetical protein